MKRQIIITADGSTTIQIEDWDEQYHSVHGAIQEAYHVFINAGLQPYLELNQPSNPISILEIGFGTGLNAFITALETIPLQQQIYYQGVEAYPVNQKEISALNYESQLKDKFVSGVFETLHSGPWEIPFQISSEFKMEKKQKFFSEIDSISEFDLIYFDAFGARVQPELWDEAMFERMFKALKSNGVLVTYSAKGSVRRAMIAAGFQVEKLPGPPGKREMLRALKG
ncbi:MAG: SAM-dependent methyltransferase [Bacteroidetes bacterium MedPE-SWsnd-G2]|nr:MAG: SAM-dependent methyltransferase [Bacteroidetes bacterium MedPE-SWsnd-G2]